MARRIEQLLFELRAEGVNLRLFEQVRAEILRLQNDSRRAGASMRSSFDQADRALVGVQTQLRAARQSLLALAGAGSIVQVISSLRDLGDEAKLIKIRVSQAADGQDEFNQRLAETRDIARNVRAGLFPIAQLYSRTVNAIKIYGGTAQDAREVTEAFTQSLKISGATVQEQRSAILQLSQALQSGKLAGDEFRTIAEAAPRFFNALADGIGVARSELKAMSAASQLTTEVVVRALIDQKNVLAKEFATLPVTMAEAGTLFHNAVLELVGDTDEMTRATDGVVAAVRFLADHVGILVTAIGVLASTLVGRGVAALLTWRRNLRLQRAEVLASIVSAHDQSVAELANARAAVTAAQARLATARADFIAARAMDQLTGTMTQQRIVSGVLTGAAAELTVAMNSLAAAEERVAVTGAAAAAATSKFGKVLGFLGGWTGVILTALVIGAAAFTTFGDKVSNRARELAKDIDRLEDSTDAMLGKFEEIKKRSDKVTLEAWGIVLDENRKKAEGLRKELDRLNTTAGVSEFFADNPGGDIEKARKEVSDKLLPLLEQNARREEHILERIAEARKAANEAEIDDERAKIYALNLSDEERRRRLKELEDREKAYTDAIKFQYEKRTLDVTNWLAGLEKQLNDANKRIEDLQKARIDSMQKFTDTLRKLQGGAALEPKDATLLDVTDKLIPRVQKDLKGGDFDKAIQDAEEARKAIEALHDSGKASDQFLAQQLQRLMALNAQAYAGAAKNAKSARDELIEEDLKTIKEIMDAAKELTALPMGFDAVKALESAKTVTDAVGEYLLQHPQKVLAYVTPVWPASFPGDKPVAEIQWTKPGEGQARGGPIFGPGTGTSDSVPIWASNGEFVVRAEAVRRYGLSLLEMINGMRLPGFARGGFINALDNPLRSTLAAGAGGALQAQPGGFPSLGTLRLELGADSVNVLATADMSAQIAGFFREARRKYGGRP